MQLGVRTRASAGVILSLLSQEQSEYLRLEVSHACWSLFSPALIALIVLFASRKVVDWGQTMSAVDACQAKID